MLDKYVYEDKTLEGALEKCYKELECTEEDIYTSTEEDEGGFLKSKKVILTVIKKEDVKRFIKYYIKTLGNLMCLLIDLEVTRDEDIYNVKMASNNNPILIGKDGRTLNAIQILIRQTLKNQSGLNLKVNVDASNYKGKKINNIEYQVKKICREVLNTKVEAKMDPMNSYERRAVHTVVGNYKDLETESFGEEPERYVVIRYKGEA